MQIYLNCNQNLFHNTPQTSTLEAHAQAGSWQESQIYHAGSACAGVLRTGEIDARDSLQQRTCPSIGGSRRTSLSPQTMWGCAIFQQLPNQKLICQLYTSHIAQKTHTGPHGSPGGCAAATCPRSGWAGPAGRAGGAATPARAASAAPSARTRTPAPRAPWAAPPTSAEPPSALWPEGSGGPKTGIIF